MSNIWISLDLAKCEFSFGSVLRYVFFFWWLQFQTWDGTIATCVIDMELNHKQASSALFFSLTRIKVGFLARGLRQKVLESSHGDGFFSRISTRKFLDLP